MKTRQFAAIFLLPFILLLSGCWDNSLTFQVRFAEIHGLKQNAPVYFQQNRVGVVQKVTYTQQGDYLVEITIEEPFRNVATVDSRFYVEDDLQDPRSKAVAVVQERSGGNILGKGATVAGSVKTGFLEDMVSGIIRNAAVAENEMRKAMQRLEKSLGTASQKVDEEMTATLNELTQQFQMFGEKVQKAPDAEEIKQLERSVKQFVDAFNKEQQKVRDHIWQEVMPQLRMELDKLREQLRKDGRDKEIEEIDRSVNKMIRV